MNEGNLCTVYKSMEIIVEEKACDSNRRKRY